MLLMLGYNKCIFFMLRSLASISILFGQVCEYYIRNILCGETELVFQFILIVLKKILYRW